VTLTAVVLAEFRARCRPSLPGAACQRSAIFLAMEEQGKASPPEPASSLTIITFGPVDRHGRPGDVFPLARCKRGKKSGGVSRYRSQEFGRRSCNAPVTMMPSFIELRGELFVERDDAGNEVSGTWACSRCGPPWLPRLYGGFGPSLEITRAGIAAARLHGDFPRAFGWTWN